jgi:hypothetical protein
MRVAAPNAAGFMAAAPAARRAGGGFTVSGDASPKAAAAATAGPRAVAGIDALLALQGLDEPGDRRRRAVRRGRAALDALDALKLGLVAGTVDAAALRQLDAAASVLEAESGDPRLDAVLAEIELRARVELAKFADVRRQPARP